MFGLFTLMAVFFAGQVWLDYAYAGVRLSWSAALALSLADWWLWACLTPPIVWLARRARLDRGHWLRALAVHLPASLVITIAKLIAKALVASALTDAPRSPVSFLQVYVTFLTYWAIVGVTYAIESFRLARERQVRAAQLEAQLARAQVEALRSRLHPHFLFNALNTIAGLMREDVEAADVMMARLGTLLRAALDEEGRQEVPLQKELQLAELYLDIQRARYGERLTVRMTSTPDALACLVPTFVLQPIVENAIRHGIASIPGPGLLEIDARRQWERILLEVRDNGHGPRPREADEAEDPGGAGASPEAGEPGRRSGEGLENTRARLRALYGERASLTLETRADGGATARITLPARPAHPAQSR